MTNQSNYSNYSDYIQIDVQRDLGSTDRHALCGRCAAGAWGKQVGLIRFEA